MPSATHHVRRAHHREPHRLRSQGLAPSRRPEAIVGLWVRGTHRTHPPPQDVQKMNLGGPALLLGEATAGQVRHVSSV
eukprot:scaffold1042_cov401-Prasinococcus_capsulatus_cf.AAC.31